MLNPCGANCSALHAILPLQVQWNMAFPALPSQNTWGCGCPSRHERKETSHSTTAVWESILTEKWMYSGLYLWLIYFYGYMEKWMLIELVCLDFHFSYLHEGSGSRFSHLTQGWHCSWAPSFSPCTICSSSDTNPAAWHVAAGCHSPAAISWGG